MNYSLANEHYEQVMLMKWAALNRGTFPELDLLYAVPNGGHRHITVAQRLKAEGVKPGVPDLCLPVARHGFHALYIEMKKRVGGKVSAEQVKWKAALESQGNCVHICKGWEEAKDIITKYLTTTHE